MPTNNQHAPATRKQAALLIQSKDGESWDRMRRMFNTSARERIARSFDLHTEIFTMQDVVEAHPVLPGLSVLFGSWGFPQLSAADLAQFRSLEAVFYAAGSIKRFGTPLLAAGIALSSAKRSNARVVADFCFAQILLASKDYFRFTRQNISPAAHGELIVSANEVTGTATTRIALIGCGAVARETIARLVERRFDLRVVDPHLSEAEARTLGVQRCSLPDAFATCKIVSNHLPDLPQLAGVLRHDHFAAMPAGGTFINTGRGAQIREDELARALTARPDLTALLDVTEPEPPVADSPLYRLPNVLLSPHIAGCVGDEFAFLVDEAITSSERWLAGLALDNLESPDALDISA